MKKTISELGLTISDFKVEIIEICVPEYKNSLTPLRPERTVISKVNGILLNTRTQVNIELAMDIESFTGVNSKIIIDNILKEEAINSYINDIRYIRKSKLIKINENR